MHPLTFWIGQAIVAAASFSHFGIEGLAIPVAIYMLMPFHPRA